MGDFYLNFTSKNKPRDLLPERADIRDQKEAHATEIGVIWWLGARRRGITAASILVLSLSRRQFITPVKTREHADSLACSPP